MPVNIAIFASGSGSNAEQIMAYFKDHPHISVQLLLSNRKHAGALEKAKSHGVTAISFSKQDLYDSNRVLDDIEKFNIDLIVLAGFLLLVPPSLLDKYPDRIINIHPALLPKYGGKGMYGHHVHQAVFDNMETESGMTIHLVNEEYDKGEILCQEKTILEIRDTPDIIAAKVLKLEHMHFAPTIEKYITERLN